MHSDVCYSTIVHACELARDNRLYRHNKSQCTSIRVMYCVMPSICSFFLRCSHNLDVLRLLILCVTLMRAQSATVEVMG
jgi:hypothetical protein